jgi:hypothetical protein
MKGAFHIDDESPQMTITVGQIKEARKLLGWSYPDEDRPPSRARYQTLWITPEIVTVP